MFKSLIDCVLTHPKKFILFILLITLSAGCFVYKNISVNTSNTDLLSKELTFRKNDIAFTKEFPQFSNNIIVVVNGKKSDLVKSATSEIYKILVQEHKNDYLYDHIFYSGELDFFKKNGLLYLSEEELQEKLDDMARYQPFISRLANDLSLYNFLDTINLFLSADLSDSHVERINKLFEQLGDKENEGYIFWGDLFSNNDSSNYTEIIHIQPRLDVATFNPAKRILDFLEENIKEYETIGPGVNVRLSGVVPMEQDELNTLGGGAKIGVTISLILVFMFLIITFRDLLYLLASFLTLIIGLILTTTFALFLFKELNLISIAFAVLFIGLGIDFSIHYLLRTYEFFSKEFDDANEAVARPLPKDFLLKTNKSITKALLLTAVAVAIGFFSFAFTSFRGLAQLGIIAGGGMFISLFLTLSFLPSFLILIKNFSNQNYIIINYTKDNLRGFYFADFMSFFKRNTKIFFTLSVFFLLFSIFNLKNIQFDNDPMKLRNQESSSVKTMNDLIKDKTINPHSVDVLVDDINKADELKKNISNLDEVKEVIYFKDLIPKNQDEKLEILDQFKIFFPEVKLSQDKMENLKKLNELKWVDQGLYKELFKKSANPLVKKDLWKEEQNKIFELLKSIEDKASEKKINTSYIKFLKENILDWSAITTHGYVEHSMFYFFRKNIQKFNESLEAEKISYTNIDRKLLKKYESQGVNKKYRLEIIPSKNLDDQNNKKGFVESVSQIAPNISGGAFTMYEAGRSILQSFKEAMIISICLTTLFLFFTLRNFKKVFIVFINLVAALLFSLSLLTLSGFNLNFANIIALPLLFGLGAATSIQTILRTEKFKTLDDYFINSTTPRAIVFSLLTTLGTFFVLSLSSHVGTASMGKLLIISIFSIYLANLTILLPLEKYFFKK